MGEWPTTRFTGVLGVKAVITGQTSDSNGGGVLAYLPSGRTLTFLDGTAITNNTADLLGGGVYASGAVSFESAAADVLITHNTAGWAGGGVYADGDVSFTDGAAKVVITHNSAGQDGGGIYSNNGTVTFAGAAEIAYNQAGNYNAGGGVWAAGDVAFTDTAATVVITHNTAGGGGGGIFSRAGTVTFAGAAEISHNQAGTGRGGGGVRASGDVSFASESAKVVITHNSAKGGGGIYSNQGAVIFKGAVEIAHNQAVDYGGGVQASGSISFENDSAKVSITHNTANNGGGIYSFGTDSQAVTFSGPTEIAYNQVRLNADGHGGHGGGVHAAVLSVTGQTAFLYNHADKFGGAVYLSKGLGASNLDASGGDILFRGNTAGIDADPRAQSLYLYSNVELHLTGDGNIYFDDPIAKKTPEGIEDLGNNTLEKTGTGFVQFMGRNYLNGEGTHNYAGGRVTVDAGTFRLAGEDAKFFAYGTTATFTVASGAALAGNGTITAEQDFTLAGVVSPDGYTYSPLADLRGGSLRTGTAIGTLTLVGDVELQDDLALDVSLDHNNTASKLEITGSFTQNGKAIRVNIQNLVNTANATILSYPSSVTPDTVSYYYGSVDLEAIPADFKQNRLESLSFSAAETTTGIAISITGADNDTLTWTNASGNSSWDYNGSKNWNGTANGIAFLDGDAVIFGTTAVNAHQTITVEGERTVSQMTVTDADAINFTFNAAASDARLVIDGDLTSLTGQDGILTVASDYTGELAINLPVEARGGMTVKGGAGSISTITLGDYTGGRIVIGEDSNKYEGNFTAKVLMVGQGDDNRYGGAVQAYNTSAVIFTDGTEFINNFADLGGAVYASGDVKFTGSAVLTQNTAITMDGGGVSAGGDVSFTNENATVTITHNTAAGAGGGIYAVGAATFSGPAEIAHNSAVVSGGGIYAGGAATFSDPAEIAHNSAAVSGGGVYAGVLSVTGKTAFLHNHADISGGAAYLSGDASLASTLDATGGDILFRYNTAGTTGSETAQSLYLYQNVRLELDGDENIYFHDPLASGSGSQNNTLTKSGTGFVQFMGENVLNGDAPNGNPGGAVRVDEGAFRLAGAGASFTAYGVDSAFTLGADATLAGSGTITLDTSGQFHLAGTIAPDAYVYSPSDALDGDATKTQTGNAIGTLVLEGDAAFAAGSTLEVDIDARAAQKNDLVEVTGAATYAGGNFVSVQTWSAGEYVILTATDGITTAVTDPNLGAVIQYQGGDLGRRQEATLVHDGGDTLVLKLDTKGGNLMITWTGDIDGVWDSITENWDAGIYKTFADHDAVVFDDNGQIKDVTVTDGGATVSGMQVTGDGYVFSGGAITGTATGATGGLVVPTGKLELKAAADSVTTFTNAIDFEKGIAIDADNTLAFKYNKGETITNANDISGLGAVAKQGEGTLVLQGDNTHQYTNVEEGTLVLGSEKAAAQSAVTVGGNAALAAYQAAGVHSLVFADDARLLVEIGNTDTITATNSITFGNNTIVDVTQFTHGSYDLLVADGGFVGFVPDAFITLADGQELGGRERAEYSLSGDTLTLTLYSANYRLTWEGGSHNWSAANWDDGIDAGGDTFEDGDAVLFAWGTGSVTVDDGGVLVAGMEIEGNQYTFTGGPIQSTPNSSVDSQHLTEMLVVSNGTAWFMNDITFANGIEVRGGGLFGSATMDGGGNGVHVRENAFFGADNAILTVDALTMDAGSIFAVLSEDSLVNVTNTATLDAGVKVTFRDGMDLSPYLQGDSLTILTAARITGFESILLRSYALTDLYLDNTGTALQTRADLKHTLTDPVFNLTPNQEVVAGVVEQWTGSSVNKAFFLVEDTAGINAALDSLSGESHASTRSLLASFARGFWEVRNGRPDTLREEYASAASGSGYASLSRDWGRTRPLLWFQGGGMTQRSSRGSGVARGKHYGSEFSVGGEMDLGSWDLGLAFRYADTRLKVDDRRSRSDLDNYQLGLYAVKGFLLGCGQLRTTFGLAGGYHDIEARRSAWIGNTFQDSLRSDYHAWSLDALAEAEYRLELSSVHSLAPYVAANWDSVWTKSFREHGGAAALNGEARHQGNLSTTLGLRYGARLGKRVRADLDLGWRHTYGNLRPSAALRFVEDPSRNSFTAIGAALARDEFVLGAGLAVDLTDRVFLRLDYDLNAGDRTLGHRGTVSIGVGF